MRVIECNICGETLSAANDDELVGCLEGHMGSDHPGEEDSGGDPRELVSRQAYDATDS